MTTIPIARPAVLTDIIPGARARDVALAVAGAILVGACAQVSFAIPHTPVPVTLQTFAVLVVGATFGAGRGTAAMLIYIVAGVVGMPWFSDGSSGWGAPSFGYLIGFLVAASFMGTLSRVRADRRPVTTAFQFVAGSAVIYLVGTTWLAVDLQIDITTAFHLGVRPFLFFDAMKTIVAAAVLPAVWAVVRRAREDV